MAKGQQFLLLVWKNFILQKRRPFATAIEVLLPLLFSVLLVIIRTQVEITIHDEPTTWSEFTINNLPSFKSSALPSDRTWIVAYAPNNDTFLHRVMKKVQSSLNQIPKSELEKKCGFDLSSLTSPMGQQSSKYNRSSFDFTEGATASPPGKPGLGFPGLNTTDLFPEALSGSLPSGLNGLAGNSSGSILPIPSIMQQTIMNATIYAALDNALQTQMFPQEMTDIMNIDASENNKSLVQYLTDLQMQNQLTVYIQNVSVKMMREKIVNSTIMAFPAGMQDIITEKAQSANMEVVPYVIILQDSGQFGDFLENVTKEYQEQIMECILGELEEGVREQIENRTLDSNSTGSTGANSTMGMNEMIAAFFGVIPRVTVQGYSSESSFIKEMKNDTILSSTLGGIMFKKYDTGDAPDFKYKIRLHADPVNVKDGDSAKFTGKADTWQTNNLFPVFTLPGPREKIDKYGGKPGYYKEGFLALMHAVDMAVLTTLKNSSDYEIKDDLVLKRFPYPPYVEDTFLVAIQRILPLLIMLSFFYTALSIVKSIVHEKETKMKEYMMMMGLSSWLHWLAWFMKYLIFMTISCIFITIFYKIETNTGTVLTYTDPTIIFLYLIAYSCSTITFCFMISVFFSKANVAAAAGGVLFGLSYMPYLFLASRYETMSFTEKSLSCLISNVGMANGAQLLSMFEGKGTGIQWWNIAEGVSVDDNFTFLQVILLLFLDCFLYFLVAWYVEGVWPGEVGIPKPWYFPFSRDYWCGPRPIRNSYKAVPVNDNLEGSAEQVINGNAPEGDREEDSEYFDDEPLQLRKIVEIFNLNKIFNPGPKQKIAIDKLNMTMYEGQITVLLGHNGAGKTTTMSILTGLFPPTAGYAKVLGHNITTHIESARKSMGLCPQHDILFDQLTVDEHMYFFSKLKGLSSEDAKKECEHMCQVLELTDKRNALSRTLSGGMKRKLSVGIALSAGSKFIVLDEPTAGMDPSSRRAIWDVLQHYRDKCSMLLSTHFMDEADLLGDRIAIMADGKLRCAGSSVFLKNKFGVGYHVVLNKSPACEVEKVNDFFLSHVPQCRLERTSGAEISFVLPFESSSLFQNLFSQLENSKDDLGIHSYGASITTMEEVFLCVTEDVQKTVKVASRRLSITDADQKTVPFDRTSGNEDILQPPDDPNTGFTLWMQQFYALLVKKILHSRRHLKVIISQMLVPVIFVIIAIINAKYAPFLEQNRELDLRLGAYGPVTVAYNESKLASNLASEYVQQFPGFAEKMPDEYSNLEWFLSNESKREGGSYNSENVIAASFLYDNESMSPASIAWFNAEGYHSTANTLLYANQAYLRWQLNDSKFSLDVSNHPLPRNSSNRVEEQLIGSVSGFMIAFNVVLGFSFLAASFSIFLVRERTDRALLLQTLSGVDPFCFWLSTFAWDFVNFILPCFVCLILFAAMGVNEYIHDSNAGITLLLLAMYCWSALPLTYLLSLIFTIPATALVTITIVGVITGLATIITINVLLLLGEHTTNIANYLDWAFLLLPQYCIGQGLADLYTNDKMVNICTTSEIYELICKENGIDFQTNYLAWERYGVGRFVAFMMIDGLAFFLILFSIEYNVHRIVGRLFSRIRLNVTSPETLDGRVSFLDDDVAREKDRITDTVLSQLVSSNPVVIKNLKKVYNMKKYSNSSKLVAVDDLNLGVSRGECFGLLGINGAGKTTTFKMLTGDVVPTSGTAFLEGFDITTNSKQAQQKLGYCPQFDGLIEQLTGRETLTMFARLRGVREKHRPRLVQRLAELLAFSEHIDKICGNYSGGNKRKLSTAIALVGGPPVVLLDEPSTGMDPGARRKLWDTISQVCTDQRCVIITSHSMEECEALCTRLAIMVNGQPRCLGGPQHLKNKFGQGYSVEIKLANNMDDSQPIKDYMQNNFPGTLVKDEHQSLVAFQVPESRVNEENLSLATIFGCMETAKREFGLRDYSVSQTTLEQVFLSFARRQREADESVI